MRNSTPSVAETSTGRLGAGIRKVRSGRFSRPQLSRPGPDPSLSSGRHQRAREFDFRVYSILEQQAEHALIFGRYSVRQGGGIVEKGIFWIARLHDERITSFEAFENVAEAFAEFKRRLGRP